MSTRLGIIFIFITSMIGVSQQKHLGFYFSNFTFNFERKLMNLTVDMSIYAKNSKAHPVYLVPEVKIEIFEDIPKLHVQLFSEDLKIHKILTDRTIDFCKLEDFTKANVFFHSMLNHFLNNLQFELRCPFKKGVYVIKQHKMPNYAVPVLMKKGDRFTSVERVKTKMDNHIKTVFESSYITEVCEFN